VFISKEILTAVLEKFRTKQELEEAWTKKDAPILQAKLEKLDLDAFLPKVL
jgi:hypothetical protein